jgi:NAD+ diphosphatase
MGGSPLNRLSWLRSSQAVLNAIIVSPATRWLLFNGGQPLISAQTGSHKHILAYLPTDDIKPLLGPEPFFGQGKEEGESAPIDVSVLEASRHRATPVVFLGLQKSQMGSANALPSSDFTDPKTAVANLDGTPFFSMDVADFDKDKVNEVLKNSSLTQNGENLMFSEPRVVMNNLDAFNAAIFAEARSMVDWNQRNKFCPACGSRTYSMWAGWKLSCSSLLPWANNTARKPCPTASVNLLMLTVSADIIVPAFQARVFIILRTQGLTLWSSCLQSTNREKKHSSDGMCVNSRIVCHPIDTDYLPPTRKSFREISIRPLQASWNLESHLRTL